MGGSEIRGQAGEMIFERRSVAMARIRAISNVMIRIFILVMAEIIFELSRMGWLVMEETQLIMMCARKIVVTGGILAFFLEMTEI